MLARCRLVDGWKENAVLTVIEPDNKSILYRVYSRAVGEAGTTAPLRTTSRVFGSQRRSMKIQFFSASRREVRNQSVRIARHSCVPPLWFSPMFVVNLPFFKQLCCSASHTLIPLPSLHTIKASPLAAVLATLPFQATVSYASSCRNCRLQQCNLLCDCSQKNGGWHASRLGLNLCLANDDGNLSERTR
jgi:hypothetical protein